MYIWGCQAELKIYNPHERKLDSRTTSGYFIGYLEKSKGYRFYCPNHDTRIVESGNDRFIENDEINGSMKSWKVEIQKFRAQASLPMTSSKVIILVVAKRTKNSQEQ